MMNRKRASVLLTASLLTVGVTASSYAFVPASSGSLTAASVAEQPIRMDVTDSNFDDIVAISKKRPVVFMVSAEWCGACKQYLPKITQVSEEYDGKFLFAYLDADKAPNSVNRVSSQRITGYPTLVSWSGGQEVRGSIRVGALSSVEQTRSYVQDLIDNFRPVNPDPTNTPTSTTTTTSSPTTTPTSTPTSTTTTTSKPTQTATVTVTVTPTDTPTSTTTTTSSPTTTATSTPTSTPTSTDTPTSTPTETPTSTPTSGPINGKVEVTTENYEAVMASSFDKPVILDFMMDGCIGCDQMKPVLEAKLKADKNAWTLGMLNGKKYQELWEKYDKPWFPSLVAIVDGKEVARRVGYGGDADRADVEKWIDDVTKGTNPGGEKTIVNVNRYDSFRESYDISFRHPVLVNLGYDFDVKDNYMERSAKWLGEMAEADKGKWTLSNVAVGNYYWHWIGCYKGCSVPKVAIMFQGRLHREPLVGYKTKEEYREFVNGALSYTYPVDGASASAAALPGSGSKTASREVAVAEAPQQ